MKIDEPLSRELETARCSGQEIPVIINMTCNQDVDEPKNKGVKVDMV